MIPDSLTPLRTQAQDQFYDNAIPNISLLELLQFKSEFATASPATNFQYVNVTFGSADTDTDIKHTLKPSTNEEVDYIVTRRDRACSIYHDQSGTRKAWGTGYIILRSSAANAKVRLLLILRRV